MPNTSNHDLTFLQKCTAVKVDFSKLGTSKKLPASAVQTESSPERVKASKKLWECAEVKAIGTEFSRLKAFVKGRTLPTPFGDAIYFVPNTLLQSVDTELTIAAERTIPALVENLIAVHGRVMASEAAALGPNFDPADYDTPDEIRDRIRVEFFYTVFGLPENLPNAMFAREQEKARTKLNEAVGTMQDLLRSEFSALVRHASDKLTGGREGGRPQIFRNSLVTNIREFLQVFRDRNVTDDAELEALCDRAKALLEGVNPEDLREQEPLRETVARGFADIRAQLDTMIVPKGSRNIIFDDDPAA